MEAVGGQLRSKRERPQNADNIDSDYENIDSDEKTKKKRSNKQPLQPTKLQREWILNRAKNLENGMVSSTSSAAALCDPAVCNKTATLTKTK